MRRLLRVKRVGVGAGRRTHHELARRVEDERREWNIRGGGGRWRDEGRAGRLGCVGGPFRVGRGDEGRGRNGQRRGRLTAHRNHYHRRDERGQRLGRGGRAGGEDKKV